jgi:hypothetical protein
MNTQAYKSPKPMREQDRTSGSRAAFRLPDITRGPNHFLIVYLAKSYNPRTHQPMESCAQTFPTLPGPSCHIVKLESLHG